MAGRLETPQVLILKQIIRVLCKLAKGCKATRYVFSPQKSGYFIMEDEALGTSSSALPTDVPKGHCAVYVFESFIVQGFAGERRGRVWVRSPDGTHPSM